MKIYNMEIHAIKARVILILSIIFLICILAFLLVYMDYMDIEFNDLWFAVVLFIIGGIGEFIRHKFNKKK